MPEEVLIRMKRVGICGSDIHYYQYGYAGSFLLKRPFILGHEGAGEVVETGVVVSNLPVGARVAIDPSQPCYKCSLCTSGRYNLCLNMRYLGSASTDPHIDGVFCEYFCMPARNCYPVPDNLGYAEAAMIEPLSVAIHAVKRSGMIDGSFVLITGGGAIGQLALLVARTFGAGKIALTEIIKERRELAISQGSDITLNPTDPSIKEQAIDFSSGGFDVVIEASGAPAAVKQAIELVRRGGAIVLVGSLPTEVTLPLNFVMTKELQLVGSFRFANVFEEAIHLVASGQINLKPLITNILPYNELKEAIQLASSRGSIIKVQVEI